MDNLFGFILAIFTSLSSAVNILPVPTPTPVPSDVLVRSGQYSYAGQTLKYTVNIPENGGRVSGNFSGACSGPIDGEYDSGPAQAVEGRASATCLILLNQTITADYTAHLDLEKGKAYIDWKGDIPHTNGQGSLTLDFEPSVR